MRDRLQQIALRQGAFVDSEVGRYIRQLSPMVLQAAARLLADLQSGLVLDGERIAQTPGNYRLLRRLDKLFMDALDDAGYYGLNAAFVSSFDGQLPYFREVLALLGEATQDGAWVVSFGPEDLKAFTSFKLTAMDSLEDDIRRIAAGAMRNASFNIAGLRYRDMAALIGRELGKAPAEAETIAVTGMSTYYRKVSARGFAIIEEEKGPLRYTYVGPLDKKNRPFCRRMRDEAKAGRTWTRAEIEALNNGSTLSNAWLCAGGWNCRHGWAVSLT